MAKLRIVDFLAAQTAVALTITIHTDKVLSMPDSAILELLFVFYLLCVLLPIELFLYMYLLSRAVEVGGYEPLSASPANEARAVHLREVRSQGEAQERVE